MSTTPETPSIMNIELELDIAASPQAVFDGYIAELIAGPGGATPMKIETWPGGRWFRDFGDNAGHLWAHVQSIKPPFLIELCGPLFMSAPVANNVIVRIEETEGGSKLKFRHQCLGIIPEEMRQGMTGGWGEMLAKAKATAEG